MNPRAQFTGIVVSFLILPGGALAPSALSAQDRTAARADLVREVLSSPDAGEAWSALEAEAVAAAEGPFLLRGLRYDEVEGSLALDLGGYGLPTLEQSMKAGSRTRLVVTLPGARSAVAHGSEVVAGERFADVRVRQVPYGVEVEATLPEGIAALIHETAEGVRVQAVSETLPAGSAASVPRFGADEVSVTLHAARAWFVSLRAGRPLALFPTLGAVALLILLFGWVVVRRRPSPTSWRGATDAQRLADRLISQAH